MHFQSFSRTYFKKYLSVETVFFQSNRWYKGDGRHHVWYEGSEAENRDDHVTWSAITTNLVHQVTLNLIATDYSPLYRVIWSYSLTKCVIFLVIYLDETASYYSNSSLPIMSEQLWRVSAFNLNVHTYVFIDRGKAAFLTTEWARTICNTTKQYSLLEHHFGVAVLIKTALNLIGGGENYSRMHSQSRAIHPQRPLKKKNVSAVLE